jgi:hypothetical protein
MIEHISLAQGERAVFIHAHQGYSRDWGLSQRRGYT